MGAEQPSSLIPLADLVELDRIYFKLIPLKDDAKTPDASFLELYNDPDYWTTEKLEREAYKFKNVATLFGKSRLADEQGPLYLNQLDIDSQKVYDILFNLKGKHLESYSFIPEMQKRTYVVKTRKPFGYGIFWLSHKQNEPIHASNCKRDHEFEIKTDDSCGHATLPPSRHRDDPNFHYKSYGQTKIAVLDKLYDLLLETLSDCLKSKDEREQRSSSKPEAHTVVDLDSDRVNAIYELIKPHYQKGSRNSLIFGLSGLFYKLMVRYESTLNLVQLLIADDEEKNSRIRVLNDTYKKDPVNVAGYSTLFETLEHIIGDKLEVKKLLGKIIYKIREVIADDDDQDILLWLVDSIKREHIFRTTTDNEDLHWYDGKRYILGEEWRIKEYCQILLPAIRNATVVEVINKIKQTTWVRRDEFDSDPDIIVVDNGLLNTRTRELKPFTPDHLSLVSLPMPYRPDAKCPNITKFLGDVMACQEDIDDIVKMIGNCLEVSCECEIAGMFQGDGRNGKGTLLRVIEAFIGKDNCSSRSLEELDTNRFATADLYGKMANILADLKILKLKDTGNFKMVVSGDLIQAEKKFKDSFKFSNRAKLFFSCNELPETDDKTDAFYRRWRLFFMDKHFDVSKGRDTKILKSLTTAEELSGLLNWALEQLAILRKDGGFKYTQDVDKIRDEWERHTNDVSAFLYEKCTIDVKNTEYQTRTEDLFSAYIKFCGERRSRPLEFSVFGKRLADKGIHNQRKLEYGELVRYYEGVVIGLPKESWQNKPAVFSSFDDRKEENNV